MPKKKKPQWQTQKENKLRADVEKAFKVAEDLFLDLREIKKDVMSKFPSYSGTPYSNPTCPRAKRRRR